MAIAPTVEAKRWMYSVLQLDGVLSPLLGTRYYEVPAPVDAVDPFFVVSTFRQPENVYTNGDILVMSNVYLRTLVVQQGTSVSAPTNLEAIDQRVTTLLHGKAGSTGTATIIACVRMNAADAPPDFDAKTGRQYMKLGSDWQIIVQ